MEISQFFTSGDFVGILPETILLVTSLFILSLEMFASPRRSMMMFLGILGYVVAGLFVLRNWGNSLAIFQGMAVVDSYSTFFDLLFMGIGIVVLVISKDYLSRKGGEERGEYFSLVLLATIGMMLMTEANDLIIVFLGLELLSLCLYVLVGFLRHHVLSNESGVKYLLLGAFSTGFFLFGVALVYGATGTTNFNGIASAVSRGEILSKTFLSLGIGLLLIGFSFKVAIVPFHMWSPDVYQGAPTSITAFLCTAPKAAAFGALLKVFMVAFPLDHAAWRELLWILSALTMTVGNISALVQSNVKRMLAFSSIAHAGYLTIGVLVLDHSGVSAMLFYLFVYSAMNLGAFGIISRFEKGDAGVTFREYWGIASRYPWLAAMLAIFMFSLAGFPPTAGFAAKYAIFSSAVSQGYIWLIVIAVLNSLVSVFYYIKLVVNMYMRSEKAELIPAYSAPATVIFVLLTIVILFFGVLPGWLLDSTSIASLIFV